MTLSNLIMMKIGISTWSISNSTSESLKLISKYGFKFVEFWYYEDIITLRNEIRDLLSTLNIKANSMHGPFGKEIDIASLDKSAIERGIKKLTQALEIAHFYECEILVIHPSAHQYDNLDEYLKSKQNLIESLEVLCKRASDYNITIALETMTKLKNTYRVGYSVEDLLDVITQVGFENLGICIDTGHVNLNGLDVPQEVIKAGKYLKTLHIDDNLGDKDSHLVPGEGNIPWDVVIKSLKQINYNGIFMMEIYCKPNPEERLRKSIEVARRLLQT